MHSHSEIPPVESGDSHCVSVSREGRRVRALPQIPFWARIRVKALLNIVFSKPKASGKETHVHPASFGAWTRGNRVSTRKHLKRNNLRWVFLRSAEPQLNAQTSASFPSRTARSTPTDPQRGIRASQPSVRQPARAAATRSPACPCTSRPSWKSRRCVPSPRTSPAPSPVPHACSTACRRPAS
jgi:hypothetical protein